MKVSGEKTMEESRILEHLNTYQREAVLDESHACLVNANVGSGKTTVLIAKILYLHYVKQVPYRDMVVLTFTNKAADEIRERLLQADDVVTEEEMRGFGTFHSVALSMLRRVLPVETLGYSRDFLVMDPEEEVDMALALIRDFKLKIKYKNRLKKRLEDAAGPNGKREASRYQDDMEQLMEFLCAEKIRQNKMSFRDLLVNTNSLLEQQAVSLDVSFKFRWVILDEVQDSDNLQLLFIDRLMKKGASLFAVGDPNQVIYSWRGSAFQVFYTLRERYQARELSLPVNYRSSTSILEAARRFLQNGSELSGVREQGNQIVIRKHYDAFQEACYLADKIKSLALQGISYSEIAVFYRLQSQSKVFEDVFSREGIPFEVSLRKTVGDVPVLKWCVRLLRCSLNLEDTGAGVYVLSDKNYGEGVSEKAAGKLLKGEKAGKNSSMQEEGLLGRMRRFSDCCEGLRDGKSLYEYFLLDRNLRPASASYEEDRAVVDAFFDVLFRYVKEKKTGVAEGFREFLGSSALYGYQILQNEVHREEESVKLMTLHASKGLEFSHVFITGVNKGLIPLMTRDMDGEEEERRLFFVGITRARDYLELSYYTNPGIYRAMPGESHYLRMIPARLVKWEGEEGKGADLQELRRQVQKRIQEKSEVPEMPKVPETQEKLATQERPEAQEMLENSGVEKLPGIVGENGGGQELDQEKAETLAKTELRKVRHKKYGTGVVVKDDGMMISVDFEDYGVKEFMKAFCELEDI